MINNKEIDNSKYDELKKEILRISLKKNHTRASLSTFIHSINTICREFDVSTVDEIIGLDFDFIVEHFLNKKFKNSTVACFLSKIVLLFEFHSSCDIQPSSTFLAFKKKYLHFSKEQKKDCGKNLVTDKTVPWIDVHNVFSKFVHDPLSHLDVRNKLICALYSGFDHNLPPLRLDYANMLIFVDNSLPLHFTSHNLLFINFSDNSYLRSILKAPIPDCAH